MADERNTLFYSAMAAAVGTLAACLRYLFQLYRKAMEARIEDLREERQREHDHGHHEEEHDERDADDG